MVKIYNNLLKEYVLIPYWIPIILGLKGSDVHIFAIIYNYCKAKGEYHGGAEKLMVATGLSKNAVYRSLKRLISYVVGKQGSNNQILCNGFETLLEIELHIDKLITSKETILNKHVEELKKFYFSSISLPKNDLEDNEVNGFEYNEDIITEVINANNESVKSITFSNHVSSNDFEKTLTLSGNECTRYATTDNPNWVLTVPETGRQYINNKNLNRDNKKNSKHIKEN